MATWITFLLHSFTYLTLTIAGAWFELNGTEFYLTQYSNEVSYSWAEARVECMHMGADLASIHSEEEMDQIMLWGEGDHWWYKDPYWLGFNDLDRTGYVWSDTSVINYTNWKTGWPRTENLGWYCAFTNPHTNGEWYNDHCGREKGYICRRPADVTPSTITTPATTPVPGYCPLGYFDAGNKCFKLVLASEVEGATFEEAVDRCRRETIEGIRPDIACIHSELENAIITSKMQKFQQVGLWIGLKKVDGATWLWVDNKDSTYLNWAESMPNRYDGECVEMAYRHPPTGHTGTWYNRDCKDRKGFVCQVEKDPAKVISTPQSTTTNTCPSDYIPYNKGCYHLVKEAKVWSEANKTCINSGAHLVSIHSEPEDAAVLTMWSHLAVEELWIGLYDNADEVFHWTDSWYVLYTRWANNEPQSLDGRGCVSMDTEGKWSNKKCDNPLPFICKTTTAAPITTPSHGEGKCPKEDGWMPFGDFCYKFERNDRGDWVLAQEKCVRKHHHAQLASIHDPVENDWIFKNMLATDPWADAWIGLFRGNDGEFQWIDGTFLQYTHWMPGSPSELPNDKACVVMSMKDHPKLWVDTSCTSYQGYICKAPKSDLPTPPPNLPGICPVGWTPYGSACYWFEPDMFSSWSGAQVVCVQKGGEKAYIASVYHEHENDFIHQEMMKKNNLPKTRNYWLGGKKSGIGQPYHWQNGDNVSSAFWARDYPNSDPNGIMNCVEVDFEKGLWKNTGCGDIRGLVCKVAKEPLHPSTTANFTSSPTTVSTMTSSEKADTSQPGMHGWIVATIILAVLLTITICIQVAFIMLRYRRNRHSFSLFNNPLTDRDETNMPDYGTRSVEFRHGSTVSKDHVRLDRGESFEQEQSNEYDA